MQPYQEEYISNIKEIRALAGYKKAGDRSFEEYFEQVQSDWLQKGQKIRRNMDILRYELFPALDNLFEADTDSLEELSGFAACLLDGRNELDSGLFCQIHQALLSLARLMKDRNLMIQELYWLGIGRNSQYGRVTALDLNQTDQYVSKMRLCFAEAAACLKYYDEIEDTRIRGYILRSRANMALGRFKNPSERIRLIKETLQIMQDPEYQKKEPDLPWEAFILRTHQLMAASMSHSREHIMPAQDVADVMESVYIVYQKQIQEAGEKKESIPAQILFQYHAAAFYCGFDTVEGLLEKLELLMDAVDMSDYSIKSMYGVLSVPAFYSQYLSQYPELAPKREEYLNGLYRRIVDYVAACPDAAQNESMFFYLRQLIQTFIETKDGLPYGEFLERLLIRFAPDVYVHSRIVGRAAEALCRAITEAEPDFFDDIGEFRSIEDPQMKRREVSDYAMKCGMFHDVGKVNFMKLYSQTGRQWFEEEYEMAQLHTFIGGENLSSRLSTVRYAAVAYGHHCWYDGSRGYPQSFKRLECSYRQMVDVVALIDWLENVTGNGWMHTGVCKSFNEAIEEAVSQEGRRFSPLLTAWLQDEAVARQIREIFESGRREAYYQLYQKEKRDAGEAGSAGTQSVEAGM